MNDRSTPSSRTKASTRAALHRSALSRLRPGYKVVKVTLRASSTNDADFLYRLHCAAMRAYVMQTWGQWDEAWQSQYFHQHFNPIPCQIVVFQEQDIGVVCVERRATDIFLRSIELLPAYQAQGIGTQLIRALLDEAHQKGVPLVLQVLKVNPARKLYERLGFAISGETATHYLMSAAPKARTS